MPISNRLSRFNLNRAIQNANGEAVAGADQARDLVKEQKKLRAMQSKLDTYVTDRPSPRPPVPRDAVYLQPVRFYPGVFR
ncbi:MAG: hypothetical protein HY013_07280 [Candidatus Solibacter usitatus]|nr:hypothetical protein [Candidatus Solibacter usitatus]